MLLKRGTVNSPGNTMMSTRKLVATKVFTLQPKLRLSFRVRRGVRKTPPQMEQRSASVSADGEFAPGAESALCCCNGICAGFMSAPRTVRHCPLMRGVSGNVSHTHSSQTNLLLWCQLSPTLDNHRQPSTQHVTINTHTYIHTVVHTQTYYFRI